MSIGGGAFVAEIADDGLCLGLGLQVGLQRRCWSGFGLILVPYEKMQATEYND